jgi:hypothetical protein
MSEERKRLAVRNIDIPDMVVDFRPRTFDDFVELIHKANTEAFRNGIKANSIIINENMVRVPEMWIPMPSGTSKLPAMICGLNVYWTMNELPENYSFAVYEKPDGRLAEFESIGMEPEELRKAAELYRKVKEVLV